MRKILPQAFFNRPTLTVAEELIGTFLVRKIGKEITAHMITETEAYDGFEDKASHARRGQTPRNMPMFGKPGIAYVYFTYGLHWMLNIVCGPRTYPAAVLIRALTTPLQTGVCKGVVLNGPAKLTKALKIDKKLNGLPLGKKAGLWIEDRGVSISPQQIRKTPRIGVDYAGRWAKKPWRFLLVTKDGPL